MRPLRGHRPTRQLLQPLLQIHEQIRNAVVSATEHRLSAQLAEVSRDDAGDTIYAVDVIGEDKLMALLDELACDHSFVLIAEGLPGGKVVLPRGTEEQQATWRFIVDPIDGTRELMYQKRSAWILTGVAPNLGPATSLKDIVLAIQTEIPLMKQHLCDQLWAARGQGAKAERYNRLTGERMALELRPSRATTIAHGFAMISRFFPGARDELAAIDEEIVMGALGPVGQGKAHCFEDQYLSSGGQLYELIAGHYRFVADLRPLMKHVLAARGNTLGICCHPYDLCSALIATEMGVIVTDAFGRSLDAPLNVDADVSWAGYANEGIRRQIEPLLQAALRRRGWI
jgi:fructose-1,6-bisphosphatase/inositol monophosphatase family enzyme